MADEITYTPLEVSALLQIMDKLVSAYRHTHSDASIYDELEPGEDIGTPVKIPFNEIFKILEGAGIEDPEFMDNDFSEMLSEEYDLNFDGSKYWLS